MGVRGLWGSQEFQDASGRFPGAFGTSRGITRSFHGFQDGVSEELQVVFKVFRGVPWKFMRLQVNSEFTRVDST